MNIMEEMQNRIAVDVVLFPPDAIMDKAIEANQAPLENLSLGKKALPRKY